MLVTVVESYYHVFKCTKCVKKQFVDIFLVK